MPVEFGCVQQVHDRRSPLARAETAGEQPILSPQRDRPDQVLDPVVVDAQVAVVDVARERDLCLLQARVYTRKCRIFVWDLVAVRVARWRPYILFWNIPSQDIESNERTAFQLGRGRYPRSSGIALLN